MSPISKSGLKHDAQGFLVGTLIEVNRELLQGQGDAFKSLESIKRDVHTLARRLFKSPPTQEPAPRAEPGRRTGVATVMRARDARGRYVAEAAPRSRAGAPTVGKRAAELPDKPAVSAHHSEQQPRANGKFVAEPGAAGSAHSKPRPRREPDDNEPEPSRIANKLGGVVEALKGLGTGAEQMDPSLTAAHEIKQVVEPLARGTMALFRGSAEKQKERKREVWYKRFLKAITGSKEGSSVGGGGEGDGSGVMGMVGGMASRFVPMLLAVLPTILGIVGVGLAALVGTKIGGAIYDWLDKSGIATKVFDAFDSIGNWFKNKVKKPIGRARTDYDEGQREALASGQQLDQSGRVINDPRRLDAAPAELPPSRSIAQSAGRAVGATKRVLQDNLGYRSVDASNDPLLAGKLDKGYRKRQDFSGIAGGADLASHGTYTAAEAQRLRDLKSTGQNTAAFGKGGMTPEMLDKIAAQAKASGMDPVTMQKIVAMESGGNANAVSKTGAIGVMQITGQTATGLGVKDRFDADQNIAGGIKLAQLNTKALQDAKLPVTAENLYMMHQLGPKAAKEVITGAQQGLSKDQLSPDTQKAMNLNYGAKSATAADYISTNKKALDDRYASVTAGSAATQIAGSSAPGGGLSGPPAVNVATAAMPVPNVPSVPSSVPAKIPEVVQPTITEPPASEKDRPLSVTMREPIGQDVGDRNIAHIVSGGLGGS